MNNQQINSLTGLRAIAAAMVVFGHILDKKVLGGFWWLKYGWTGVSVFFVLSGFLFTILYLDKFTNGVKDLKTFYLKRVFRIYPVYLFVIIFTFITSYGDYDYWNYFAHITFLHGFTIYHRGTMNGPMWTLGVEAMFYAVIPFLLYWLGNIYNFLKVNTYSKLLIIFMVLWIIGQSGYEMIRFILEINYYFFRLDWDNGYYTGTLFGKFLEFGAGIWAGFLYLKIPKSKLFTNVVISNILFIIGMALMFAAFVHLEESFRMPKTSLQSVFYNSLLRWGPMLIIISLVGNSIFNKFFSSKVLVYLGEISFSLYLIHFANVFHQDGIARNVMSYSRAYFHNEYLAALMVFIFFNILAAAVYHSIEKPAQKYLTQKYLSKNKEVLTN